MNNSFFKFVLLMFISIQLTGQEELYSDSISVYFFMGEDCKICQYYGNEFIYLHDNYASEQLNFIGLFPNKYSTEEGIKAFKEKYEIPFPIKREYFQTKTKAFEVKVTPEVVVFDEKKGEILYQGRIDDSFWRVGKRKRVIRNRELRDALDSIKNQALISQKSTSAIGCFIGYNNP